MFKNIKAAIEGIVFNVGIIPNSYAKADEFMFKSQVRTLQETLWLNNLSADSPMAQVYIVIDDNTVDMSANLMDGVCVNVDGAEYYVRCKAVRIPASHIPFDGTQTLKLPVYITDEDGDEYGVSMTVSITMRPTAHKCLGKSQKDVHAHLMAEFKSSHEASV